MRPIIVRRSRGRKHLAHCRHALPFVPAGLPKQKTRHNAGGPPPDCAVVRLSNEEDVAEVAAVVRNAAALSDYVIISIHAHEGGGGTAPAEFVTNFAHAMIDAGAAVFVGHGPHYLRGIEVYRGKPIFYSLGDFIFQNETLLRLL